jgi:hypothetical protein
MHRNLCSHVNHDWISVMKHEDRIIVMRHDDFSDFCKEMTFEFRGNKQPSSVKLERSFTSNS